MIGRTSLCLAFTCLVALSGCDKKSDPAKPKPPDKPIDVDAVNALVPASLKGKVVFEKTDIVEERGDKTTYTVAAPKGWKQGMKGFASLKPETDFGGMTQFELGTNCDGLCEPKDWDKVIDKVYASYLSGKVTKNERSKNARTLIAEAGSSTLVLVASWEDGASHYSHCGANLGEEAKELAAAVEKACAAVNVH